MADVFAPQPVKTKNDGDVVAKIVDSAGSNKAAVSATGAVSVSLVNTAANATAVKVDGSAVTQPVSITGNQAVNVAQINGVTPLMGNGVTGTGSQRVTIASDNTAFSVNSTLSAETTKVIGTVNVAASQTIGLATGSATIGALTANQSVNNNQIAGTAVSTGNGVANAGSQRVTIASDNSAISVTSGLTGTTQDSGHLTSASLAAGGTVTLDSTQIASGTGKVYEATVSSSVALRAQLGTWDGTTFTVARTFFVPANSTFVYVPARYDEITKATGATAKFRWSITNNDNANAADVYASITYAN